MTDEQSRRQERADRLDELRAAQQRRRERESERAQELLDRFVAAAVAAGLPTEELVARPWTGAGTYPTGLVGWHLRPAIGVTTDGAYYVLTVPPRRLGRFRRLHLDPVAPPLQVGEGARDGESIALQALLELRLAR